MVKKKRKYDYSSLPILGEDKKRFNVIAQHPELKGFKSHMIVELMITEMEYLLGIKERPSPNGSKQQNRQ